MQTFKPTKLEFEHDDKTFWAFINPDGEFVERIEDSEGNEVKITVELVEECSQQNGLIL